MCSTLGRVERARTQLSLPFFHLLTHLPHFTLLFQMHIAIVGAGFSGLVTASTLLTFGHSIVIFDTAPDVGGVWSRSKRYPGLRTQNPRDTYALSSMRMSASYPLHPKGEHVQAYLEEYARLNGLHCEGRLRLGTEVVNAERKTTDG